MLFVAQLENATNPFVTQYTVAYSKSIGPNRSYFFTHPLSHSFPDESFLLKYLNAWIYRYSTERVLCIVRLSCILVCLPSEVLPYSNTTLHCVIHGWNFLIAFKLLAFLLRQFRLQLEMRHGEVSLRRRLETRRQLFACVDRVRLAPRLAASVCSCKLIRHSLRCDILLCQSRIQDVTRVVSLYSLTFSGDTSRNSGFFGSPWSSLVLVLITPLRTCALFWLGSSDRIWLRHASHERTHFPARGVTSDYILDVIFSK